MNLKLTRTETCKKHLETLLYKNGFQHNSLPYPNLISIRGFNIQVVCPHTNNPKYLAVNANTKSADFYVGYIWDENGERLMGFAYRDNLEFFHEDPNSGWRDPTYRTLIEHLQHIHILLEILRSPTNNYV